MADWAPVIVGFILFVLLSPGLLFQFPGSNRGVEFGTRSTSPISILVHSFIFFGIYAVLILVVKMKFSLD